MDKDYLNTNENNREQEWTGWQFNGSKGRKNGGNRKIIEIILICVMSCVILLCLYFLLRPTDEGPGNVVINSPGATATPFDDASPLPTQTPGGDGQTTPTSSYRTPSVTMGPPEDQTPSPTPTPIPTPAPTQAPLELVKYTGRIEHIFTHSLVAFPQLAYTGTKESIVKSNSYFRDCITVSEFKALLEALYADGYMLVNLNDVYEAVEVNGTTQYQIKKDLMFPKGKKPLVFSFDDVNYDPDKAGRGMVDRLILDQNGKVVTYTKMADGTEIISDDNEHIPILDKFVEEHPDFSFNGAKGMLCLTGFTGILGYRTDRESTNREAQIEAVKPVIAALKETGWYFASHSYKHGGMSSQNVNDITDCATKFLQEVIPLIGETKIYVFPYGDWGTRTAHSDNIIPTRQVLVDFGFEYFCGVGIDWYIKTRNDFAGCILQDRANIDGLSLVKYAKNLNYYKDWGTPRFPSLNAEELYDAEARGVTYEEAKAILGVS